MLCQECGKRPAAVHIKRVMDDKSEELHLCTVCAKDKGELFMADPTVVVQNFLAALATLPSDDAATAVNVPRCRSCGFSYQTFLQTGRLGCPDCYRQFTEPLEPLVRRLQGRNGHVGKVPRRRRSDLMRDRRREELRRELQRLVEAERYEEAATVRDEIRALETESTGEGKGDVHP